MQGNEMPEDCVWRNSTLGLTESILNLAKVRKFLGKLVPNNPKNKSKIKKPISILE